MNIQSCQRQEGRLNLKLIVFSGLLLLQAGFATAQNLATNPGFETGDTTGWFAFGSPTLSAETVQVHSGNYACLVTNRTASYMGAAQSFAGVMQANQTYDVSAWVRLVSGPNQTVYLTFQKTDGNPTSYAQAAVGSATTNGWTQISGQYTLTYSGTLSALNLYAELPNSTNAAYYIDDLSVQWVNIVPANGQCTVDWSNVFQRIDGFGASSAWRGTWTPAQADMFFSTNNGTGTTLDGKTNFSFTGCGLSLLRSHVVPAGTTAATDTPWTYEASIMQMAQARGARVWSTPWTTATGFKNTNDIYDSLPITNAIYGGSYLGSGSNITNINYASQLANYVVSMKNNGVNLYALSIQNEPDASVNTYEACQWTGAQFHDFVTNLYNALVAKGVGSTKIILPESENWASNTALYTPTLNDANAAAAVSIIANHDYVGDNVTGDTSIPAALSVPGKAVWETEVSQFGSYDGSITNALYWAGRIHLFMTAAQANAWHFWWLIGGSDNEGLTDGNGMPAKRMYALGQFARFVRPNYYRINVGTNTGSALVSAYKDSASPNFTIVAINTGSTTVTQAFYLANVTAVSSVTPWITSATMSLSNQTPVAVSGSSFSYALPAMSIVTFTGQSSAGGPLTLAPVANQTINAGMTLVITNVATDPNVPPLTLNFSLLQGPAGATLTTDGSGTNGIFTWRPPVGRAGTTNPVSVQVAESGSPNLGATNNFNIIVNPLNLPVLGSVARSNERVNLVVSGDEGPDYTLLTSTNLVNWQALFTSNSPVTPVTLVDTNSTDAARFYRIQLGP
jgi:glucuronoarabinoxylan endo-1,4-beta-xylanase